MIWRWNWRWSSGTNNPDELKNYPDYLKYMIGLAGKKIWDFVLKEKKMLT